MEKNNTCGCGREQQKGMPTDHAAGSGVQGTDRNLHGQHAGGVSPEQGKSEWSGNKPHAEHVGDKAQGHCGCGSRPDTDKNRPQEQYKPQDRQDSGKSQEQQNRYGTQERHDSQQQGHGNATSGEYGSNENRHTK